MVNFTFCNEPASLLSLFTNFALCPMSSMNLDLHASDFIRKAQFKSSILDHFSIPALYASTF